MGINKATAIKLQKQTSLAVSEMNFKDMVDSVLEPVKMYRLVNMITGEELSGVYSLDDVVDMPLRALYEMHPL